jgi:hypothetical protein
VSPDVRSLVVVLNTVLALVSLVAFYLLKNHLRGYDAQPTRSPSSTSSSC